MLEPEVLLTVENDSNSSTTIENYKNNSSENSHEKIEIKKEICDDVDEFLKQLHNINTSSISNIEEISSSDDEDPSENEFSNGISKMPAEQFISKTAQNICKMIEINAINNAASLSNPLFKQSINNNEKTALHYFLEYFPEQIFFKISNEMNISTNPLEVQELFGVHILMNVLKYPRYDMYWSPLFRIQAITERMSKERFETLRNNLVIVKTRPQNISDQSKDNLWRIRPIVNSFTKKCQLLATELNPCVDEQIIPFLLYLNTIKLKKQRKVLRVLFSFVGLAVKNSWLEYKKYSIEKLMNPRKIMDFLEFTLNTVKLLLRTGRKVDNCRKRHRSLSEDSLDENAGNLFNQLGLMPVNKKSRLSNTQFIKDVRYDGINHWPIMDKKPQRCKLENCPKKASVKCFKCNLHLCMSSNRNCFMLFHTVQH